MEVCDSMTATFDEEVPGLFANRENTKTMHKAEFFREKVFGKNEDCLTGCLSKMGADFASTEGNS